MKVFLLFFGVLLSMTATSSDLHRYKIEVWSDNWFAAFIDGEPLLEDSVSITTERSFNAETHQFTAPDSFQLAFVLKDFKENNTGLEYIGSHRQQMGDGGFITQITNLDTGDVVGVSTSAMQCKVIHKAPLDSRCADEIDPQAGQGYCQFEAEAEPAGWKLASFDDSAWQQATEYSAYQVRPKGGYDRIDWDSKAKLIWGDDLEKDNTVLCRLAIGANEVTSTASKHTHDDLHAHFSHFDNVSTRENSEYLLIESNGLAEHEMMTGITNWQQQVPLPQDYTGTNSWKIPLKPTLAAEPLTTKNHFHRGAIAIAVNGIPIFNAMNNRGEFAADIGELDQWGGHSGRGDDYHYHLAPVHLEEVVGEGNPIAYALDGFPLYGKTDKTLDEYLGRFTAEGSYQYHAVDYPPYLIAGLRGEVQVDSLDNAPEDQIEPQPRSQPVRTDDYGPLKGAEITGFSQMGDSGYLLEYTLNGESHKIHYHWDESGAYEFTFIDQDANEVTESYQKKTTATSAKQQVLASKKSPSENSVKIKGQRKYCGDGLCDSTENSKMCPVDCTSK